MKNRALISVVLAGVFWGIISLFIRRLAAAGIDPLQISAIRMIIAAVSFTAVIAVVDRQMLKIRLRDIWMFVCTGIVSVVFFNVCYFYTIIHSQASIAVVLLYTSPVFIMLMSALFFKEKITWQKIAALLMTIAGCVLVAGVVGGDYLITPVILLTGLASGLFYGLYTIFGRIALANYDTITVTAWTLIMAAVGSVPLGKIGGILKTFAAEPELWLYALGIGVVSTAIPYFLYTWGLKRLEPSVAAIVVAVEPLVGAVIGMTVFHESHNIAKIAGICFILAAMLILNLHARRPQA